LNGGNANRKTLQFSTRELVHFTFQNILQIYKNLTNGSLNMKHTKHVNDLILDFAFILSLNNFTNFALDLFGDVVNKLRLDDGLSQVSIFD
jgi:hypothetical protein